VEIANSLWVEKYRPKKIDDLVLPERYSFDFKKIIEKQDLPNLLFSGPPGSGKSTLARILTSKNGVMFNRRDNLLTINGSAQASRGIGYFDKVVEPFLKTPPARDKYKIVFIDEADNLTGDSYKSLRGIIEKYQIHYGRFIMTCNYVSNIPSPVQSRFTHYVFKQIPREFAINYCKEILQSEKIEYELSDLEFLVDQLYPDIRQIVDSLQRHSKSGKFDINKDAIITNEKKIIANMIQIIEHLEKGQFSKIGPNMGAIVDYVKDDSIEYRGLYMSLFYSKIPAQAKIIVNKYSMSHQSSLIPSMNFMAMVFEIIQSLKEYRMRMMKK